MSVWLRNFKILREETCMITGTRNLIRSCYYTSLLESYTSCRLIFFCVYCVTVDTLVDVWLNFGVCMYVYEDSNFGSFRIPYVYAYAHIWLLKTSSMQNNHNKVASTLTMSAIYNIAFSAICIMF